MMLQIVIRRLSSRSAIVAVMSSNALVETNLLNIRMVFGFLAGHDEK